MHYLSLCNVKISNPQIKHRLGWSSFIPTLTQVEMSVLTIQIKVFSEQWYDGHASTCLIGIMVHGGCICSFGYFMFQPVVHNWSIKGWGMCCPVCGKVLIKDPLQLIGNSSLCGDSGLPLKKYIAMNICFKSNRWWYENQCALEGSLNKTNFPFSSG